MFLILFIYLKTYTFFVIHLIITNKKKNRMILGLVLVNITITNTNFSLHMLFCQTIKVNIDFNFN